MRTVQSAFYVTAMALALPMSGCGDDEGTGAAGGGGDGGSGGGSQLEPALASASAPTRTTVRLVLSALPDVTPLDVAAYALTSSRGPVAVEAVELDPAGPAVLLTTAPQKLGIDYTVKISDPGGPLDSATATFPSADTATFWASDFADFSDYEVTASRRAVGQHVVVYLVDGIEASDVDETVDFFDTKTFETETTLFGPAPDRDDNGKVVLLGLDGDGYYGGYFNPMDSLTDKQAKGYGSHSNELEMLYLSVPDLMGSLSGPQVVAHEFQHLLYNEAHDFFASDWSWHNEGLAECAVHAVNGKNEIATYWYTEPQSGLATGQSLVVWQYSNYSQYAQAYVFWTYVASRLGGVAGYGQLFQRTGSPTDMDAFLQSELGVGLREIQGDMLAATVRREATGKLGFEGMVDFMAPTLLVPAATSSVELLPYTGVLFPASTSGLLPTGQGVDVVHFGVPTTGVVQTTAPFDVVGGVVVALNGQAVPTAAAESSGTLGTMAVQAPPPPASPLLAAQGPVWMHPPPLKPANRAALREWRLRTAGF